MLYARTAILADMGRGCFGGCLSRIVIVAAVFVIAGWWAYSSLTLETLGKADEVGLFGFLGEEYEDKTARDLGIEDLTVRSIVEYFRRKLAKDKEGDERAAAGVFSPTCFRFFDVTAKKTERFAPPFLRQRTQVQCFSIHSANSSSK